MPKIPTPQPPPPTPALLEMYYPPPLVVSVMNAAHSSGPQRVSPVFYNNPHPPHTNTQLLALRPT